jgi:hypothetical protein
MKREYWKRKSVPEKKVPDGLIYIRLVQFTGNQPDLQRTAVNQSLLSA